MLREIGAEQLCPRADLVTPELVRSLHREGISVRPWKIPDRETMEKVFRCGVDGMTVNFPDLLLALLNGNQSEQRVGRVIKCAETAQNGWEKREPRYPVFIPWEGR